MNKESENLNWVECLVKSTANNLGVSNYDAEDDTKAKMISFLK